MVRFLPGHLVTRFSRNFRKPMPRNLLQKRYREKARLRQEQLIKKCAELEAENNELKLKIVPNCKIEIEILRRQVEFLIKYHKQV